MEANAYRWSEVEQDQPIPLLSRRKITGDQMLVARVFLEKGCKVAWHHHVSEQIAIIESGHCRWTVGTDEQVIEMRGGEVLHLPSNCPHAVEALEDTEIIDVLSPPGQMGVDRQDAAKASS